MAKIVQYANQQQVKKFKNEVWLREKEAYKNLRNVIYIGTMFFKVQAWSFCSNDDFTVIFINFHFMMFTQVLMKKLAHMLIHACKISTLGCLC